MKKYTIVLLIIAGSFLSFQLAAQADQKTQGTGTTTGKKSDTQAPATVPAVQSTKTAPGKSSGSSQGTVTTSKSLKTGKMYDATGNLMYSYDELGYIRNPKNRVFCQYTAKGEIIRKRTVVGTVEKGVFRDRFGKEYARLVQEGKVVDGNSKMLGTIKEDGTVLDKSGKKIGSAPGVDKNVVIIIYFYKDLLEKSTGKSSVK